MLFRNDKRDNRDASSTKTVPLLPLRELDRDQRRLGYASARPISHGLWQPLF
jgi:hypothetical protein